MLGTLLHELLHAWQDKRQTAGKRNYYNAEFRDKARAYGLLVDSRGVTSYAPEEESPFRQVLAKHGVAVPPTPAPLVRGAGDSKLKKWTCGCVPPVNVRVGRSEFHALCLVCSHPFAREE